MKTSEIFKQAEKYLWNGLGHDPRGDKVPHLCRAVSGTTPDMAATAKARNTIIDRIFPHSTYTNWTVANGHLPIDWWDNQDYWYPIIQANRLRWLRELQREYRKKGD